MFRSGCRTEIEECLVLLGAATPQSTCRYSQTLLFLENILGLPPQPSPHTSAFSLCSLHGSAFSSWSSLCGGVFTSCSSFWRAVHFVLLIVAAVFIFLILVGCSLRVLHCGSGVHVPHSGGLFTSCSSLWRQCSLRVAHSGGGVGFAVPIWDIRRSILLDIYSVGATLLVSLTQSTSPSTAFHSRAHRTLTSTGCSAVTSDGLRLSVPAGVDASPHTLHTAGLWCCPTCTSLGRAWHWFSQSVASPARQSTGAPNYQSFLASADVPFAVLFAPALLSSWSRPWLVSCALCCTTPVVLLSTVFASLCSETRSVCVSVSSGGDVASGGGHGPGSWRATPTLLASALSFPEQEGLLHLPIKLHLEGHFKQPFGSATLQVVHLQLGSCPEAAPRVQACCCAPSRGSIARRHAAATWPGARAPERVSPAPAGHREHDGGAGVLSNEDCLEKRSLHFKLAVVSRREKNNRKDVRQVIHRDTSRPREVGASGNTSEVRSKAAA
ncbi:hypothetical protein E2C01_043079 [Portunus trituberculatus]|uniref:Uncharacterized protein n=1 Tax=Portunus trituberculatus TaxID=210409 RepID=A0A5B7FPA3_PORTR|nr:hypothetical protein [Portunus trituberculatus]